MSRTPVVALLALTAALAPAAEGIDPLVKASAYADKTVWSYHDSKPVPWARFKPRDFGGTPVNFSAVGVRDVGKVPAPGVHPRIFFGPEDLPGIRKRLKEDEAGKAAWLNIQAWCHALKKTYDEKADYAQPDWANGGFGIRGRFVDLMRIGGYGPKRDDYFQILADGQLPERYTKKDDKGKLPSPATFFKPAACEAFRCLIEEDHEGAKKLAKAVITAVKGEQARRAAEDKPVEPGQPPRPSTGRSDACGLGYIYDFIYNDLTAEQKKILHEELVLLSSWADNYGTFNNAEASRSNWATFSYWVFDLMAIEGEPGFNDLKFLGLYRGWRNFYTYSFFDSGAAYEAEGKLLMGLDAAVAFDRVAHKYGLERLTQHPLPRSYYGKFSANAMLPTRDKFAVFDILGSMGGGFTTPQDLVIAKWLYPQDKTTDFVYRAQVGDDYKTLPYGLHFHWHNALNSAIFATAYEPTNTPEKLDLPQSFFCGQRALMMTRSSWDRDATFLTTHVRGASGGHPYPDRGGLMLAAQGRPWVTIPGKDQGAWACSTVLIDGAQQTASTPGRVVDYADGPQATAMAADLSYCWNWVWGAYSKTTDGTDCTRAAVDAGKCVRSGWSLVDQTFNDFAYTKAPNPIYNQPLKYNASWIGFDGLVNPFYRQVNTPVMKAFRSTALVRGPHPYVLVVDDMQRDDLPARYEWNLTLMNDVVRVEAGQATGAAPGDILLVGKTSLEGDAPKTGEPALLVRVLDAQGERLPDVVAERQKVNLLTIATKAVSPNFKVLIYAHRIGDPLPVTGWDASHRLATVAFPGQEDRIATALDAVGRTGLTITRAGKAILALSKPTTMLRDAPSEALAQQQRANGPRFGALQAQGFNPAKLPGFAAGWNLTDQAAAPVAGSDPKATAFTLPEDAQVVEDDLGRKSIATGKQPLKIAVDPSLVPAGPCTVSVWVKTRPNPFFGQLFNVAGIASASFVQGGLTINAPGGGVGGWSSAMVSSWTHLALTWDGTTLTAYRNGIALSTDATTQRKIGLGKTISLGGPDAYGNADTQVRDLFLYRQALDAQAVRDLYLSGR